MGIQQHEGRKRKGLAAGAVQRIRLAEVFGRAPAGDGRGFRRPTPLHPGQIGRHDPIAVFSG